MKRTQADRDDDLAVGRELERKDHQIELLRAALIQVRVTCEGNAGPSCDKGMALKFVGEVAAHALR